MVTVRRGRTAAGKPRPARASFSLLPGIYSTLKALAREKKVSVAWVMRDAAEKCIARRWTLLETKP